MVMATVCSKWAERLPSRRHVVHSSSRILLPGLPMFAMGSMAMTMPASAARPFRCRSWERWGLHGASHLPVADEISYHRVTASFDITAPWPILPMRLPGTACSMP